MSADIQHLLDGLLGSQSEADVVALMKRAQLWEDSAVWHDFADNENNFSTIGNQQANPEAALVEKLVNSIDAVLMLECRLAGIDPEGSTRAPRSIREAVAKFFGIRDGRLAELTGTKLSKYAARIGLVATGSKRAPNLTVFDSGEGQEPDRFHSTFLSLGAPNKRKIPFVQGKFNMGGTGVFQFCGKQNLQLIVSRRHPELAGASADWGFTLVRREDPAGNRRSSVYRYFAPNGRIPRVSRKTIVVASDSSAPSSKYALALIGSALLRQHDNEPELADGAKSPEERVAEITRALGPVLLPTISGLADVIDDSSTDSAGIQSLSRENDDEDD